MIEPQLIAKVCHEVNRIYCTTLGDYSQVPWDRAEDWQKKSAEEGVRLHLDYPLTPEESHISWMEYKKERGWKYGEVKDAAKKEHPCMVDYHDLPKDQQIKDSLFKAVVEAFL
jgi:hypothetical protein